MNPQCHATSTPSSSLTPHTLPVPPSEPVRGLSYRECAKALGVSSTAIARWVRDGNIQPEPGGGVDLEKVREVGHQKWEKYGNRGDKYKCGVPRPGMIRSEVNTGSRNTRNVQTAQAIQLAKLTAAAEAINFDLIQNMVRQEVTQAVAPGDDGGFGEHRAVKTDTTHGDLTRQNKQLLLALKNLMGRLSVMRRASYTASGNPRDFVLAWLPPSDEVLDDAMDAIHDATRNEGAGQ
ncbi:MAG: hypothetical protein HQL73_03590 [Magnetococcales bacterium]|nr:hypothetical protein [Magnetococcales bacterium]